MDKPTKSKLTLTQAFNIVGLVCLAPFGLMIMIDGQLFWGGLTVLAAIVSGLGLLDSSYPAFNKIIHLLSALIPGAVTLAWMSHKPDYAMLWSFPLMSYVYYQLPIKSAAVFNGLLILLATIILLGTIGDDILLRFIAAHTVFGVFSIVFSLDRIKHDKALHDLANVDELTQLPNRRKVMQQITDWCTRAQRYKSTGVLVFIDIDNFKKINDKYGHDVGDQVLIQLADLLKQRLRDSDLIGRIGGEEFLLLLDYSDKDAAMSVAQSMLILSQETDFPHNHGLGLSIGLAEFNSDESQEEWIRRADQSMYTAKQAGGGRFVISS